MASHSSFKTLQDWLNWQETLHPSEIDLGLERVRQVLKALTADSPFTVVTVAGTNGKGSTVAMLEAIFTAAGYKTGSYTSPHLIHYNERIKINQKPVSDELICQAFERIDRARDDISLTYFEFGTLAAIDIFHRCECEIVILEVGLGGRLDAVNVIDPDVALITTVDIDHQDWLGSDRNTIALEKAGIYRQNKPAIYGDINLPETIRDKVLEEGLDFYQFSQDYGVERQHNNEQWNWLLLKQNQAKHYNLPLPQLKGSIQLKNAANVMMVLELLKHSHPVSLAEIKRGLHNTFLAGRFQVVSTRPLIILDVAHNEQAAENLRHSVEQLALPGKGSGGKVHVIVGMLKDKEVSKVLAIIEPIAASWRIIELDSPRAMPANEIKQILSQQIYTSVAKNKNIKCFDDFEQAYQDFARYNSNTEMIETLLIFGSFFTVSDALQSLSPESEQTANLTRSLG